MKLRNQELKEILAERNKQRDLDDLFMTSGAIFKIKTNKGDKEIKEEFNKKLDGSIVPALEGLDQFALLKRKNIYNEDEVENNSLPEENMVLATWINDLGNNHKEFDVRLWLC